MFTLIQLLFPRTFARIWNEAYDMGHDAGWNAATKSTWRKIETR